MRNFQFQSYIAVEVYTVYLLVRHVYVLGVKVNTVLEQCFHLLL